MSRAGMPPSSVVQFITGWKRLYQCAILENDSSKLPRRIAEARHAIHSRAEKMTNHWIEREARDNRLRASYVGITGESGFSW